LPISSSGHLSVAQHFMGLSGDGALMLTVFLHIGTLVAVIAVYYKTFWSLIKEIGRTVKDTFTGKLDTKHVSEDRHLLYMMFVSCLPLLFLYLPVGGGNKLKDLVEGFANDDDILLEGFCFLITAILLFASTHYARTHADRVRPRAEGKDAWWIGVAQLFAASFPGISRSGSTIATGMLCGVEKNYMVRYSFVLGTPAVLAASVVELKDALSGGTASLSTGPILVGIVTAAVVGVLAIKLLEWLVKKDKFEFFGYYCILLSALVIAAGVYEKVAL
ncbi:MAG: undecaprenyl-diphosphate phosphatase, partial [Clostridia bacterium]|nr:undecaprenyl-diphosphate phosphatase [Clostridia bacterium]